MADEQARGIAPHEPCPPLAECPCASTMGYRLLRELMDALGVDAAARTDPPAVVWREALLLVRSMHG